VPTASLPRLARVAAVLALGAAAAGAAPEPGGVVGDAAAPGAGRAAPAVVVPVDGPVARLFVRPPERWAAGHRGVDLLAEPGTEVRSPVAGEVTFAGPVAGRTVLTVARADGLLASLEPLADVVPAGTAVAAGDVVGALADDPGHCAPASCLHWGVRVAGDYVDPLSLLGRPPVVLLE
jgi:murein DD-endopeptidase MepM/ murein hydrolase activator NlpD